MAIDRIRRSHAQVVARRTAFHRSRPRASSRAGPPPPPATSSRSWLPTGTVDRFEEFFALLPSRADSDHSWTVARDEIEARKFDLKAVNPNAKSTEDTRTPEELLDIIELKGREVDSAIAELRRLLNS
jgi:hypothetical protein